MSSSLIDIFTLGAQLAQDLCADQMLWIVPQFLFRPHGGVFMRRVTRVGLATHPRPRDTIILYRHSAISRAKLFGSVL